MKNYIKPQTEIIRLEKSNEILVISNCICHGKCTCDHNNNSNPDPNGNQPICTCKNRPKVIQQEEQPMYDWPE